MVYKNAKVITVGNRGVGKSSLNQALGGEAFVSEIPVEAQIIRLLDRQEHVRDDGCQEVRETFLWDPGGRSGYQLTHQLYLRDVAVALVVLDIRNDRDIQAGVREWARAIQRIKSQCSAAMKMFLVITYQDRGGVGSRFSRRIQDLKKKLGFDEVFETSAREGWGIDKLRKAILEAIDWEKQPEVCSTTLLQDFQIFLDAKKLEARHLLPEEELYEAFEKLWSSRAVNTVEDPHAQFELCIQCLEAQGVIRRLATDTYILLEPELLDIYASGLLDEARDDPEGFGCIDEESARRGKFSFVDERERMKDRALERILLGSIVDEFLSYKIAFREHIGGSEQSMKLIFPSQATQENYDMHGSGQTHSVFHFSGEVLDIYTTLEVRLAHSKIFVIEGRWHHATTYTVEAGKICGISLHILNETQGSLTIFFDAEISEQMRHLFAYTVHMHLLSYDRNVAVQLILRCPQCGTAFTEKQEKEARARHKNVLRCPACSFDVRLSDEKRDTGPLDMQQVHPDTLLRNHRKEEGMYDALLCCSDDAQDKEAVRQIYDALEKHGIVVWFEEKDLLPGHLRLSEIGNKITQVQVAVICFGNISDNPRWLNTLMDVLLNQHIQREYRIIPVLLEHGPREKPALPFPYTGKWVDFHQHDPNPIEQLVWGIKEEKP